MKTVQPTPEELLQHHVDYEIAMLEGTHQRVEGENDEITKNALRESFCIHARGLIEFFRALKTQKEYLQNANYSAFDGVSVRDLKDIIQRLNNQVAHILEGRTADENEKISASERRRIYDIISIEITSFNKALKPKYQGMAPRALPPLSFTIVGSSPNTTNQIARTTTAILSVTGPLNPVGSPRK